MTWSKHELREPNLSKLLTTSSSSLPPIQMKTHPLSKKIYICPHLLGGSIYIRGYQVSVE